MAKFSRERLLKLLKSFLLLKIDSLLHGALMLQPATNNSLQPDYPITRYSDDTSLGHSASLLNLR